MRATIKSIVLVSLFLWVNLCFPNDNPNADIDRVIKELSALTIEINNRYDLIYSEINSASERITFNLSKATTNEEKIDLLIKKDSLLNLLEKVKLEQGSEVSKIRYLKGLEIIKILYEKALSLDHHFESVATFNEINNLSNPNHYPEFEKMKDAINSKQDKKQGFNISSILGDNIYTSVIYSFVSLFTNNNIDKQEKEASLKDVECILDFTLRMHNDLKTIYFETAVLQTDNDNMIKELEQLFVEFTKPIGYKTPLKECRSNDDWDSIKENLNNYLEELDKAMSDSSKKTKAHKMHVNLEFPIDRLLQFITLYNSHIDRGAKFYEKFGIMLNSYDNQQQCASKIPIEFSKLKDNINKSIEKFNTAYKPVEINGSKMKELLYGINDYN